MSSYYSSALVASNADILPLRDFQGRVALITGASRGIGRECALALAKRGCNIVIAAKTVKPHKTLPGTIYTVAEEVEALGSKALPFQCDLRDAKSIERCVEATIEKFGKIDFLINNASALWWQDIKDTPVKRYDLITTINARGTFLMTKAVLPHMEKNNFGRVVNMSPPLTREISAFAGKTAYNISKLGMTMVALGVAAEYSSKGANISSCTLWPATVIESLASINFKLGDKSLWRHASIISDATITFLSETDSSFSGKMLIDDEYLRSKGLTNDDFVKYRCDPECEPPRLLASEDGSWEVRRGSVTRLDNDMDRSSKL